MKTINPIKKTLLMGIGNYSQADDGLGWKFADEFSGAQFLDVEHRYQLQVEDAELVSQYDLVIFVDASREPLFRKGYSFRRVTPALSNTSSHHLTPDTILWLAQDQYASSPESYVLAISGNEWERKQGLSKEATKNMKRALLFFDQWLEIALAYVGLKRTLAQP